MPLNWNASECADPDFILSKNTDDNTEWIKTECLIFFTMNAGLRSDVTVESAPDFYARIHFWEKLNGAFVFAFDENDGRVEYPFTPEDIQRRIGLSTNGWYDKKETWGQYVKRITQHKESEAKRRYDKAVAE